MKIGSVKICMLALILSGWIHAGLWSHDLFLRPDSFNSYPGEALNVTIYNGTFEESVASLQLHNIHRLEIRGPQGQAALKTDSWQPASVGSTFWQKRQKAVGLLGGFNLRRTTAFEVQVPLEGTYTVGLMLTESRIALTKEKYIEYLNTEAFTEVDLSMHPVTAEEDSIRERYQKSAKTILQFGDAITDDCLIPMGFEAEIVPLMHPATVKAGETIVLQLLRHGQPVVNQSVAASRKGGPFRVSENSQRIFFTDDDGKVEIPITQPGIWWVKFIYLTSAPEGDEMDYFSRWASLTFEIN